MTELKKIYLLPGSVFIDELPHVIEMVLGSCIAVALWDVVLQYGSINHYMLPEWSGEGNPTYKYGSVAIPYLINKMLTLGSKRTNLQAKVFGGSVLHTTSGIFNVGQRNTQFAFNLLQQEHIPVVNQDVGGTQSRKVIFNSASGEVFVRMIQPVTSRSLNNKPKFNQ
ncbi:chemotaxis protein CheD [Mucilaginibacter robiniae]|uniref:Probable chemoreceptor glutamine deamidase CheD n=1 Tax=Mucilaginibacter robiniae TaxID=2728022 RepID=A0A7L5E0I2_9SPHI|nr:chemotaxis protein CheD [Mucilaginibacter robiniae]QJD96531.1 chemotaxis protein CheD [Mucilaginibacter robiniae]